LPEEFDELSPKEELYYQKPPFSTNEVFLGSKGGVSQLVDHGPSGVRQGYAEKKPRGGQKKPEKIETLRKLIAEANAGMKYFTWETIAARMNVTRDAAYMLAKKNNLPPLDSYKKKINSAFDSLFVDADGNWLNGKKATDVAYPTVKVADMVGPAQFKGGKDPSRVRTDTIIKILKNNPVYQELKNNGVLTRLNNAPFWKKVEKRGQEWLLQDVFNAGETASSLPSPTNTYQRILRDTLRHGVQAQAQGKNMSLVQFYNADGKRITDLKNIDSYNDIFFKYRPNTKTDFATIQKIYGLNSGNINAIDISRVGRKHKLFDEYFQLSDEIAELRGKKYWPDGSPILDRYGKHINFRTYTGEIDRWGRRGGDAAKGHQKFRYAIDHFYGVFNPEGKQSLFHNLRIAPESLNLAGKHIKDWGGKKIAALLQESGYLSGMFDDAGKRIPIAQQTSNLMNDAQKLGKEVLVFDKKGTHIGRTLKSGYAEAKGALGVRAVTLDNVVEKGMKILGGGAKGIKKFVVGTGLWMDAVFAGIDYWNNKGKGYNHEESWAMAKQAATAGIWKGGDKEYEKELLKVGKEMGFDPTALQNMIDINKRGIKSEERTALKNKHLERINENILKAQKRGDTKAAQVYQATYDKVKSKYEEKEEIFNKETDKLFGKYALDLRTTKAGKIYPAYSRYPNLDKIVRTDITEEEAMSPYRQLQQAAVEKLERRKEKAFSLQSTLVDPESGRPGDELMNWLFNVPAWTQEHKFWGAIDPTPKMVERKKIKQLVELAKQGNPEPLRLYNEERGVTSGPYTTYKSYMNLAEEKPWLRLPQPQAGGGIVGIRKPDAVAPDSGPVSRGLRSLYIDDMD